MCGICGFSGSPDKKILRRMTKALMHRGPDDKGFFEDNKMSLGHRRLSIIDIKRGRQPMSAGRFTIVYNGEIYNYKKLRRELEVKGHRFRTESDTEVILRCFMEYGKSCVRMLNGMFAFAIWDGQKLFLARDHLGIKPLYYTMHENRFYFASEIKSIIVNENIPKDIDSDSLNLYLSLRYDPGPRTIYRKISKLMPGHCLTFDGQIHIERFWNLRFKKQKTEEELHRLLRATVDNQMMSEVPLGLFLSGGIDSTYLAALMSRDRELNTFTLGFNGNDETEPARRTSEILGTDHHEIHIGPESLDHMEKIMYHMDEPHSDSTIVPTYFLSKYCKKHATVILTGEGSDEMFAGYEQYKIMQKIARLSPLIPRTKANLGDSVIGRLAGSATSDPAAGYLKIMSVFSPKERSALLASTKVSDIDSSLARRQFKTHKNLLNKMQYFDTKSLLPQLLMKVDKMTMANSVEARVPFLDQRIVGYAASLPTRMRLNRSVDKYILRKNLKKNLPNLTQNKKQRFYIPMEAWHKEIQERLEPLLENKDMMRLFKRDFIKKLNDYKRRPEHIMLLRHNKISRQYYARKTWSIFAFANWYRAYDK